MVEQLGLAITPLWFFDILRIHLGDNQGYSIIHSKGAGIIHHDSPRFHRCRSKLPAPSRTGRKKRNINIFPLEAIRSELFNNNILPAEFEGFSGRSGRGESKKSVHGKIAFFQGFQHLCSDSTGCTDYSYSFTHNYPPILLHPNRLVPKIVKDNILFLLYMSNYPLVISE